ncbi:class I SAM-dependent methyltransferase [Nioella nitratireducens]|uniref:class I SAM-dependent methyltransferase n=1 Tax=Nioella nitratireducens TaxID=1287720 RepID=UPI0008FCE6B3|nr:methyltransferase domain-containing protein [Nioella nitratireducens]
MDIKAVQKSYARWAPVYDRTFGLITNSGRRRSVDYINATGGKVLEVGVGTGLALPFYGADVSVTGVDFSEDMLARAREKVRELGLRQVVDLRQMDARALDFPDDHFDIVTAMHVLSVVPDPEQVMSEIARVCKPGGQVVIANHFARDRGILAMLERITAPLENVLGWHSDFELDRVLQEPDLSVEIQRPHPPLGMMTFLVLTKS